MLKPIIVGLNFFSLEMILRSNRLYHDKVLNAQLPIHPNKSEAK